MLEIFGFVMAVALLAGFFNVWEWLAPRLKLFSLRRQKLAIEHEYDKFTSPSVIDIIMRDGNYERVCRSIKELENEIQR